MGADVWSRVVGQDRAVALLQRAAERPAHAYLLVGSRGSGVEEAARCFAAAVVAPDGDERAVDLALRGAHPDIVEIDPATNQIRVEDAQQIIDEAYRSPIEGARKVIIVYDAERLRFNDQAANKLLKTLEEPPPTALIVLVTAGPDQLLPTIRSRCQRVDFAFLNHESGRRRARGRRSRSRTGRVARASRRRSPRPRSSARHPARAGAGGVRRGHRGDGRHGGGRRRAVRVPPGVGEGGGGRPRSEPSRGDGRPRGRSSKRPAIPIAPGGRSCAASRSTTSGSTGMPEPKRSSRASPRSRPSTATRSPGRRFRRSTPIGLRSRSTPVRVVALDACRDARQALIEHNPNESLMLERLLLHLPAASRRG